MKNMNETVLKTEKLTKNFGALKAVNEVDLDIKRGEIRAIIGPNGAGKSTLMDLIVNRTLSSSGKVLLRGQDITHKKQDREYGSVQMLSNQPALQRADLL